MPPSFPLASARFVENVNGLRMHLLEAGHEDPDRPCLLLLHGFHEVAYSWRRVMPALAEGGYHVVAPDLRGYGRTAVGPVAYAADLASFLMHNLLLDLLCLLIAMDRERVAAVIGHDFSSWVAGFCALVGPDVFGSVVLMTAPFAGTPTLGALAANRRHPRRIQSTPLWSPFHAPASAATAISPPRLPPPT